LNSLILLAVATAKSVPTALASLAPKGAVPPNLPVAPPVMPIVQQKTFVAAHAGWLTHGIAGVFVLSAIVLVALLAVQTTKQEGLSGTIGGRVESAYRGRLGAEEQLKRVTGVVAVCFVISAFILSITGI
jgi:preprotein translocase subunit SecG